MNITDKISSYFMSPDDTRQVLSFLRKFNESHVPKNYGCDDINGSQYVGVIENFGSELLLETRKMLMDRPSLKHISIGDSFNYYFDIKYAEQISTYNQQNMIVAFLRNNVILDNKTCYIEFRECNKKSILRSKSWGDVNVYRDVYLYTNIPPMLIILDKDNPDNVEEIELCINDTEKVEYLYNINPFTMNFIDYYDEKNNILKTKYISNTMSGNPMIWVCANKLNTLPDIGFDSIINGIEYLTIGTDGHNISRLYPINIDQKLSPSNVVIKAFFNENDSMDLYKKHIKEIHMCFDSDNYDIIKFNDNFVNITLSDEVEWVYDEYNECAYISTDSFYSNLINDDKSYKLISAFVIEFDSKYIYPLKKYNVDLTSGIHIDSSSEYSDNGVFKKNGVVHGLGDFDGLPEYFQYLLDRTIHRSHMELYTSRTYDSNQKNCEKQTAALILDSGVPKNEINDFIYDLPIIIKYDISSGKYISDGISPSSLNHMSEITFIDNDTFGNSSIDNQDNKLKFIYHGDGLFTLHGIENLDPNTENGRVYYLSNDNIIYENNEKSTTPKPDRCICRICDIPTSFVQLIKIEHMSPTLVIDKNYVRTETNFAELDKEILWNNKSSRLIVNYNESKTPIIVFSDKDILDDIVNLQNSDEYYKIKNLNSYVKICESGEFEIVSGGYNYSIGDRFNHILGGISIIGEISATENGIVKDISIINGDSEYININNLSGKNTSCETTTVTGNGDGLLLNLKIYDDVWEDLQPKKEELLANLFVLKFDKYNNIWVWEYDSFENTWIKKYQLLGNRTEDNTYDDEKTYSERILSDVFIKNLICKNTGLIFKQEDFDYHENLDWTSRKKCGNNSFVDESLDISSELRDINNQDSLYFYDYSEDHPDEPIICKRKYENITLNMFQYILPRFHNLNLSTYQNKSNSISYGYDNDSQIIPFVFNPIKDTLIDIEKICTGLSKKVKQSQLTFKDIIKADIYDNDEFLNRNIYTYNELSEIYDISKVINKLNNMNHEELILYIKETFGEYPYPIYMENTSCEFSEEMLRNYIIQNIYTNPIYKKNDIYLLRQQGERVVEKTTYGEYVDVGDQPKGLYINISEEIVDSSVNISNKIYDIDPLFVFYVDEDLSSDELIGFRIIDDNGFDVTDKSILICKKTKMICISNVWTILN